jgi:hypothetical protein
MRPDRVLRHFLLAFVLALIGYIAFYQGIEHRRTWKGPWQVAFRKVAADAPTIVINQPRLGVTNVQISFTGEIPPLANPPGAFAMEHSPSVTLPSPVTNTSSTSITLRFAQPQPVPYDVPFGSCIFMDTTFLPGTVTFRLFDHEIELLPRVLIIDHEEHSWQPNAAIALPRAQISQGQTRP